MRNTYAGGMCMAAQHKFSFGGFMTGVGLSASCAAGLLVLKQSALLSETGGWLPWAEFVSISSMCLLSGVWFGWSANRSLAIEGLRVLRRFRRRQWIELFGFPLSTAFAGVVLGVVLSFPKWFYLEGGEAWTHMLSLSGGAAIVGFIGGFGSQFAPVARRGRSPSAAG
jgi:hypothetical protein